MNRTPTAAAFAIAAGLSLALGPAALAQDALEPNDAPDAAARLAAGDHEALRLAGGADWYRVEVAPGGDLGVRIAFDHDRGDLDLALGTVDQRLIERSDGTDDAETIVARDLAGGDYLVLVHGYEGATNDYRLLVRGDVVAPSPGGGGIVGAISPLEARFTSSREATPADTPTEVTFRAEASGGAAPYRYAWDFDAGAGSTATGRVVSHVFPGARPYEVVLTVSDADGRTTTARRVIGVEDARLPDFTDVRLVNRLRRTDCAGAPVSGTSSETIAVSKAGDRLEIGDPNGLVIAGTFERRDASGREVYALLADGSTNFPAQGEATIWREGGRLRLVATGVHFDRPLPFGTCQGGWTFDARQP